MTDYSPVTAFCEARLESIERDNAAYRSLEIKDFASDLRHLQRISVAEELRGIITLCNGLNFNERTIERAIGLPCSVKEVA